MRVTSSTVTIAEYCAQMKDRAIIVNHRYQRSEKVWPPAARSYLIESILLGFPIPKLSLYQSTDLKTKRTTKSIVEGQQRSLTIFEFLEGNLRIIKGRFGDKTFNQLEEDEQQHFVDYVLTVDVFVNATPDDIRQAFRRMNSYTVPLNPQEKRHATDQGEFKWFIVELVETYAESLKKIGVFKERQLSRMSDAALFSDLVYTFAEGIKSASDARLNEFYKNNDEAFPASQEMRDRITSALDRILEWSAIHDSALMKPYNFSSLMLALSHAMKPVMTLQEVYERAAAITIDPQYALPNLTLLAQSLEEPTAYPELNEYIQACSKATTRKERRKKRFEWLSKALEPHLLR